jgi:hypothetical protein
VQHPRHVSVVLATLILDSSMLGELTASWCVSVLDHFSRTIDNLTGKHASGCHLTFLNVCMLRVLGVVLLKHATENKITFFLHHKWQPGRCNTSTVT